MKLQNISRGWLIFWILLLALGVTGVFLMDYLTPFGMGLVNDSVAYIGGARNVLAGNGYSRMTGDGSYAPITHFPPILSLVLVSIGLLGPDPLVSIRWVNILFFGANILLSGIIVRRITGSRVFGILGALLFLLSDPLLRVHSFALSEPLYLFISMVSLCLLVRYLHQPAWYWLVGAGLLASIGYLTRYVGISLYGTTLLVLLVFGSSWKNRLWNVLLFMVSSLPLVGIWSLRSTRLTGNATNRPMYWHPPGQDKVFEGLQNFWGWLLPEFGGFVEIHLTFWGAVLVFVLTMIAVVIVLVLIRHWKRGKHEPFDQEYLPGGNFLTLVVFTLYGLVYLGGILVAMTLFDDRTILEIRMIAPFLVSILFLLVWLAAWFWKRPKWVGRLVSVLLMLALLASYVEDSMDTIPQLHTSGQGYASGRWRNSETIAAVKKLPDDILIYSNKITALEILADRPGYLIPWPYEAEGEPDPIYYRGIGIYRQNVLEKKAVVAIFEYESLILEGDRRISDMTQRLNFYRNYSDGAIFGYLDE
jgi:hypothetical protein